MIEADDLEPTVVLTCDTCAVIFAVPVSLHARHSDNGRAIWCPNGHLLGADYTEPASLALQRCHDLCTELGSELALERIDHLRTHRTLDDLQHGLRLGRCPTACGWESKILAAHLQRNHPLYGSSEER